MTAKKLWARKFNQDSQELYKNSQGDISWTSSGSEDDEPSRKKIKTNNSNSWIKPPIIDCFKNSDNASQYSISNETVAPSNSPTLTYNNWDESPIISNLSQEELSPVLANDTNVNEFNETSPVIGKRGILKKVRSKYKQINKVKHNLFPARAISPDIFLSQPTQLIDNNSSPEHPFCKTRITISQSSECLKPVISPQISEVTKHSTDTSSSNTNNSSLYNLPLRKRKRYKKGGIASLLQKTLRLQKTRVTRWQHEMYTNKLASLLDLSEGDIVEFMVKKSYKDYGSVVIEAELLKYENETSGDSDLFRSDSGGSNEYILVVVSLLVNISFIHGEKYQLFPPYCSKDVTHRSRNILCYYGVSKIKASNTKQNKLLLH